MEMNTSGGVELVSHVDLAFAENIPTGEPGAVVGVPRDEREPEEMLL